MMKPRPNKTLTITILTTALVIISVVILRPVVNRLQDDADTNQVYSASTKLTDQIKLYKSSNPQKTVGLSDVQNILKQTPSLQNLRNPQTNQPYIVKSVDAKDFITGPNGMEFLNYAGLDGTSFYFGSGSCSDPSQKDQSFIAYSINLKRTGEAKGSCREI